MPLPADSGSVQHLRPHCPVVPEPQTTLRFPRPTSLLYSPHLPLSEADTQSWGNFPRHLLPRPGGKCKAYSCERSDRPQDITRPAAPPPLLPWVCSCAQTPKTKRVLRVVLRCSGGTGDFLGVTRCGQPTVTCGPPPNSHARSFPSRSLVLPCTPAHPHQPCPTLCGTPVTGAPLPGDVLADGQDVGLPWSGPGGLSVSRASSTFLLLRWPGAQVLWGVSDPAAYITLDPRYAHQVC